MQYHDTPHQRFFRADFSFSYRGIGTIHADMPLNVYENVYEKRIFSQGIDRLEWILGRVTDIFVHIFERDISSS